MANLRLDFVTHSDDIKYQGWEKLRIKFNSKNLGIAKIIVTGSSPWLMNLELN